MHDRGSHRTLCGAHPRSVRARLLCHKFVRLRVYQAPDHAHRRRHPCVTQCDRRTITTIASSELFPAHTPCGRSYTNIQNPATSIQTAVSAAICCCACTNRFQTSTTISIIRAQHQSRYMRHPVAGLVGWESIAHALRGLRNFTNTKTLHPRFARLRMSKLCSDDSSGYRDKYIVPPPTERCGL